MRPSRELSLGARQQGHALNLPSEQEAEHCSTFSRLPGSQPILCFKWSAARMGIVRVSSMRAGYKGGTA